MSEIRTRLLAAPLAVAAVAGLVGWDARSGGIRGLGILLTLAVVLGLREFYALAARAGSRPFSALGLLLGGGLCALTASGLGFAHATTALLLCLTLGFTALMTRAPEERRIEDLAVTLLGIVYLWLPLSFGMRLRTHAWGGAPGAGMAALVLALASVKGGDVMAYFLGSRFGKHRLAPFLSPGKSWEGLAGAALGGALAAWGVALAWPAVPIAPDHAVFLGAAAASAGQLSDLWESLLKRQAGAKQSGAVLPALGGVLDMVDSLILGLPVAYYGLVLTGRAT